MSMAGAEGDDDERLLAELGDAVHSREAVPERFLQAGRGAFAWHDVDVELAALTYDSSTGGAPVGVRADRQSTRALTFVAGEQTIELEVSTEAVLGQVVPAAPGTVELHVDGAGPRSFALDETGWFELRPGPAAPFRLGVRTPDGKVVLTERITP